VFFPGDGEKDKRNRTMFENPAMPAEHILYTYL